MGPDGRAQPGQFADAEARLVRANELLRDLLRIVIEFNQGKGHRGRRSQSLVLDSDGRRVIFRVHRPFPDIFALLASECIHHVRSALDNLIYDLAGRPDPGDESARTQFVILRRDEPLRRSDPRVHQLDDEAFATLANIQPSILRARHPERAHDLLAIELLANIDKHRILPFAALSVPTSTAGSGDDPLGLALFKLGPLRDGMEVWSPGTGEPEWDPAGLTIFCEPGFDDTWPSELAGRTLYRVLDEAIDTVENFVLPAFRRPAAGGSG